jgi:hypothetical protein
MLQSMNVALFLAMLSPTMGFSIHHNNKVLKTTTRSTTSLLRQEKITWSDYKHDFIDPIAAYAKDKTKLLEGPLEDPRRKQRDSADEYWLEQFEADEEQLQNMNQTASSMLETSIPPPKSTWDQYNHEDIDPLLRKKTDARINPERWASTDHEKIWLKTVLKIVRLEEVKEKLQNMNEGASPTPETSIPPVFPIWDQYNHNYIDSISSRKESANPNRLHHGQPAPETRPASVDKF